MSIVFLLKEIYNPTNLIESNSMKCFLCIFLLFFLQIIYARFMKASNLTNLMTQKHIRNYRKWKLQNEPHALFAPMRQIYQLLIHSLIYEQLTFIQSI